MDRGELLVVSPAAADDSSLELGRRLTGYGVAGLAITGIVAANAGTANATVIVFTPTPLTASINGPSVLFDFATGTSGLADSPGAPGDPQFSLRAGTFQGSHDGEPAVVGGKPAQEGNGSVHFTVRYASVKPVQSDAFVASVTQALHHGATFVADNIAPGQSIDRAHQFFTDSFAYLARQKQQATNGVPGYNTVVGQFIPGQFTGTSGALGLEFKLPDGEEHFGWADVIVNPDFSITLTQFGYETTPDTTVTVPTAAPEASPFALLLIGGPVALGAYRKMRRKNGAPELLA